MLCHDEDVEYQKKKGLIFVNQSFFLLVFYLIKRRMINNSPVLFGNMLFHDRIRGILPVLFCQS